MIAKEKLEELLLKYFKTDAIRIDSFRLSDNRTYVAVKLSVTDVFFYGNWNFYINTTLLSCGVYQYKGIMSDNFYSKLNDYLNTDLKMSDFFKDVFNYIIENLDKMYNLVSENPIIGQLLLSNNLRDGTYMWKDLAQFEHVSSKVRNPNSKNMIETRIYNNNAFI